jgi:hypothetical protein
MKLAALVVSIGLICAGCATSYHPQDSGRISFVLDSPGISLYKDGQRYAAGGLSSDPIRAVAGNPVAENHARVFVQRSRIWAVLTAVAVAALATSIAVNPSGHGEHRDLSGALAVTGFASLAGGAIMGFTRVSHIYDAVNIYNDGLGSIGRQSLSQGGEAPSNKALNATGAGAPAR